MKALVVGASAGVGRALTEALAKRGDDLLIVASNKDDLEAQAAHLRLLFGVQVKTIATDANRPTECLESIKAVANVFGHIDEIFFPIGSSRSDDRSTLSLEETIHLFNSNLIIVIGLIGHFLPRLITSGHGNIVGFSSVAAVRGRRANIVYAAAKRGLESYFESLRHLASQTGVHVQLYRLGYVTTQQSFAHKLLFPSVTPVRVAETVVSNLGRKQGLIYYPHYWAFICYVVLTLPWFLFKRLDF